MQADFAVPVLSILAEHDDQDVMQYLKYFSWAVSRSLKSWPCNSNRNRRNARRNAAGQRDTSIVHGATDLEKAQRASQVLFGGEIAGLSADEVLDIFNDVPSSELPRERLAGNGLPITEALVLPAWLRQRRSAPLVEGGGIYLNNVRVADNKTAITAAHSVEGRFFVLRKGQKQYHLVKLID